MMCIDSRMPGAGPDWVVESEAEQKHLEEFIKRTIRDRDDRIAWRVSTSGISMFFEPT